MPRNPFVFLVFNALFLFLAACSSADEEVAGASSQASPEAVVSTGAATAVYKPQSTAMATATGIPSSPYPGPTLSIPATPTPFSNLQGYDITSSYPAPTGNDDLATNNDIFIPITGGSAITPAPEPTAPPTPVPTVDFTAVRAELESQGQEIGFVKTGFHVTLPEDREVLDEWMTRLDAAGVPFFLKTVDNAEPLFKAQELMRQSGVPHVLVYRSTGSVPHYELTPQAAAQHHWQTHRDLFPPELDPSLVWVETLNEPDRTQSEWLAQFALETARLAMADGFRWAAFGWASGEPEPEHWRGPAMQEFLRLAGENPDQLAVALHEYSYIEEEIGHEYPYKIGRFQSLFQITDELGIPRPTVLITEWGWEHADIPPLEEAIADLKWVSELYAAYPQVKGAAIWNVGIGCCFGDISEQVQEIIGPVTDLALQNYYVLPAEKQVVNPAQFQP